MPARVSRHYLGFGRWLLVALQVLVLCGCAQPEASDVSASNFICARTNPWKLIL